MTNEEIFRTFLKSHRKYTSFKRQLDHLYHNMTLSGVRGVIGVGFVWTDTIEGFIFWKGLDTKWKKLCVDFQLKGQIDIRKI